MFLVRELKILVVGQSRSGCANLLSSRVRIRRERLQGEKWVITVLHAIGKEASGRDQELKRTLASC